MRALRALTSTSSVPLFPRLAIQCSSRRVQPLHVYSQLYYTYTPLISRFSIPCLDAWWCTEILAHNLLLSIIGLVHYIEAWDAPLIPSLSPCNSISPTHRPLPFKLALYLPHFSIIQQQAPPGLYIDPDTPLDLRSMSTTLVIYEWERLQQHPM